MTCLASGVQLLQHRRAHKSTLKDQVIDAARWLLFMRPCAELRCACHDIGPQHDRIIISWLTRMLLITSPFIQLISSIACSVNGSFKRASLCGQNTCIFS